MRTRRRTYTSATPSSLLPDALTTKPIVESCAANPREDSDLIIPSELLQEILSRLGLKANIQASVVCKTWRKAAVSVRKLKPRPWLFYPQPQDNWYPNWSPNNWSPNGMVGCLCLQYITSRIRQFFLNPFTKERIDLPEGSGSDLAFSAAPTSSSCLVVSVTQLSDFSSLVIKTWRPNATLWTTHCFENDFPGQRWGEISAFSTGMYYCLSTCGHIGVFDPSRATWNILPVKPCSAFLHKEVGWLVLMTEHEGVIYIKSAKVNNSPVFKLNLESNVWDETREFGGLTIFASESTSLTRAGLSAMERNRIYPSYIDLHGKLGMYYSLSDEKLSSFPSPYKYMHSSIAWVDPPHSVNL